MLTRGTVLAQTGVLTVGAVGPLGASVLARGTSVARGANAGAGDAVASAPVVAQAHVLAVVAPPVHGARCAERRQLARESEITSFIHR